MTQYRVAGHRNAAGGTREMQKLEAANRAAREGLTDPITDTDRVIAVEKAGPQRRAPFWYRKEWLIGSTNPKRFKTWREAADYVIAEAIDREKRENE
jgi:hypothetical protein